MKPSVLVTVGTDHHPFDRLVEWADAWADRHPDVEVFVQHGTARAPAVADGAPLVPPTELSRRLADATAVVIHGGLSSIMEARAAGFVPLVVARDPARGEHVDSHQQVFTAHQERLGRIRLLRSAEEFQAALDEAVADPTVVRRTDDAGDVTAAVAQVGRLVEDLVARRPPRHRVARRRRRGN